ncbi:MAG: DNA-directed RNA polymerase subunit H [Nitrososphaerota archaeon]
MWSIMSKSRKKETPSKKAELRRMSILEHELVPQHRILSPEEAKEILARYGVQPQQLPYILVTDPVVKELGAKPGDIIEIRRRSPTAGEALYYRLVVTEE